jgi:hypothetical protein
MAAEAEQGVRRRSGSGAARTPGEAGAGGWELWDGGRGGGAPSFGKTRCKSKRL